MVITSLILKNFKRFTDLTLEKIPVEAKLVLLIGANGSGKSSVFDAFEYANTWSREEGEGMDRLYYRKVVHNPESVQIAVNTDAVPQFPKHISPKQFVGLNPANFIGLKPTNFYGRTSFRQIPTLTRTALGKSQFDVRSDSDRPRQFIHRDDRFENDVDHITGIILRDIFRSTDSTEQIRARYIEPINAAMERIFGAENGTQLRLIEIIPPLEGEIAQINFKKGNSEIHYNFLSAGEKEVFNVLLNLLARRDTYNDTVYFFDELDLHLNTAVQISFLKEITENWIPPNCQLWTATHSLGFIEYAKQSDLAVILDFDNLDFDVPQTITPQPKDRLDIYEIAVPKHILFDMLKGKKLVLCENQNDEYYDFKSDDLERFYRYYDMKTRFKKHYLEPFNLKKDALVTTSWFKQQIASPAPIPNPITFQP